MYTPHRRPLIVIGPSGSGKSTLVQALLQRGDFELTKTVATRPRRSGEDDTTHTFVDQSTFDTMKADGAFLGTGRLFGYEYGLPALPESDKQAVVILKASLVAPFRHFYPDCFVIQLETTIETLLTRIAKRGDTERADSELIKTEIATGRELADLIIDTTQPVDQCLIQIKTVIKVL